MTVSFTTEENTCRIRISGALTVETAADTWHRIAPLMDAGLAMEVELEAIEACDVAGLQILYLLQRRVHGQGDVGSLFDADPVVRRAAVAAGVLQSQDEEIPSSGGDDVQMRDDGR